MKKQLFILAFLLLMIGTFAQVKSKAKTSSKQTQSSQSQTDKILEDAMKAEGMSKEEIEATKKMINDSLVVLPYEGENIASYQVIVQKASDLYIIYTNLTEALPGKIDETKYKYLLQQNDNYDVIKIGMSAADGSVYLRADVYRAGTNAVLLKRIIAQVANVTNIIGSELK